MSEKNDASTVSASTLQHTKDVGRNEIATPAHHFRPNFLGCSTGLTRVPPRDTAGEFRSFCRAYGECSTVRR